jgi:hypothetical protein
MAGRFNHIQDIKQHIGTGAHLTQAEVQDALVTIVDTLVTINNQAAGALSTAQHNAAAIAKIEARLKAAGLP